MGNLALMIFRLPFKSIRHSRRPGKLNILDKIRTLWQPLQLYLNKSHLPCLFSVHKFLLQLYLYFPQISH
ncbi:unnamed protein product [Meloidogyne enterolobii]|uniref:Uncharacterized protein n=1 Tax=Meloidogyne enterolobii TaxID=390850 RepID=A0ACB0XUR7_MELEN